MRFIDVNSANRRDIKNKKKLTKKIEKLRKKQGSIQQAQYITIRGLYFDDLNR